MPNLKGFSLSTYLSYSSHERIIRYMNKINKIDLIEGWRNEHGNPDFEYLQSLVEDGGLQAREKLHEIANDLNVRYDEDTSLRSLVDQILLVVKSDPRTTT